MTELPDRPMPTVDAIWRAMEAGQRPAYDGYGISASALGTACDRQLWYGLRWASPPETMTGRTLAIFERGNWEEDRILQALELAGLDVQAVNPETGRQWTFALANGWLRGKADGRVTGVIEAPKTAHCLEIKSLKASDFRAILKHGLLKAKPEHWHQLHAGMAGLGLSRGIYIGRNKDTEELLSERIKLDEGEIAKQEARVLRVVDMHDAPGKISDKADAFACRFCRHKETCHEGAFARRHCRTCLHFTLTDSGNGHCARWNEPRNPAAQRMGSDCPSHLYLPDLVAGQQVDADEEAETVTYQMADGSIWIDGADAPQQPKPENVEA
jgi:hypothetical protein